MFICLSCHIMLFTLISFKQYCSAQWSIIVVLLCFINKMNLTGPKHDSVHIYMRWML